MGARVCRAAGPNGVCASQKGYACVSPCQLVDCGLGVVFDAGNASRGDVAGGVLQVGWEREEHDHHAGVLRGWDGGVEGAPGAQVNRGGRQANQRSAVGAALVVQRPCRRKGHHAAHSNGRAAKRYARPRRGEKGKLP